MAEAAAAPDDQALIASDLAAFDREAGQKGLSLEAYLPQILSTGPDSFTFSNKLEPETDYVAYAYGLTGEGTPTTAVFRQAFRTPGQKPQPSDCTITITVSDIDASEASVHFVPSDDGTRYFYAVLEKELFDKAQAGEGIFADDQAFFAYMAQMDNQTVEQTIRQMTVAGTKNQRYISLTPETDYYAYAYGLEPDGLVTTELYAEPFRTGAPERRECTFEILIEGVTAHEATVSIIPSDKELTYLGQYITDEQIEQGGDGNLATYYANYFRAMADMAGVSVSEVVAQEAITGDLIGAYLTDLTEGESYNVFAVGIDTYGNFVTEVELVRFTTGDASGPDEPSAFVLELAMLSDSSVRLDVAPDDASGRYLSGVLAADQAATFGGVAPYLRTELDMYAAMGMVGDYLASHAHSGPWSGVFDKLTPGSLYHAYAIGVDDNGAYTTELTERRFTAGATTLAHRMYRPAQPAFSACASVSCPDRRSFRN